MRGAVRQGGVKARGVSPAARTAVVREWHAFRGKEAGAGIGETVTHGTFLGFSLCAVGDVSRWWLFLCGWDWIALEGGVRALGVGVLYWFWCRRPKLR